MANSHVHSEFYVIFKQLSQFAVALKCQIVFHPIKLLSAFPSIESHEWVGIGKNKCRRLIAIPCLNNLQTNARPVQMKIECVSTRKIRSTTFVVAKYHLLHKNSAEISYKAHETRWHIHTHRPIWKWTHKKWAKIRFKCMNRTLLEKITNKRRKPHNVLPLTLYCRNENVENAMEKCHKAFAQCGSQQSNENAKRIYLSIAFRVMCSTLGNQWWPNPYVCVYMHIGAEIIRITT